MILNGLSPRQHAIRPIQPCAVLMLLVCLPYLGGGSALAFVEPAENFVKFKAQGLNTDNHALKADDEQVACHQDDRVLTARCTSRFLPLSRDSSGSFIKMMTKDSAIRTAKALIDTARETKFIITSTKTSTDQ